MNPYPTLSLEDSMQGIREKIADSKEGYVI